MKFIDDKRNLFIIWLCAILLAAASAIIEEAKKSFNGNVEIKVEHTLSGATDNFPDSVEKINTISADVQLKSHPYLMINKFLPSFFAPKQTLNDPVYALLLMSICVLFLIRAKKIKLKNLFSSHFVKGIYWAGLLCFLFGLIEYIRHFLLNKYILQLSHDTYQLPHFYVFGSIILWLGILLSWLYRILKQAEVLQKEQELTI
jgi:hypothetical protein